MSSVRGRLRIKNRLLAKKENKTRIEQQDQCQGKNNKTSVCKACLKDTNLHYPIQVDILVCCVNTSKMQFIPMIDRKSQDVQNGQRDVASHAKIL